MNMLFWKFVYKMGYSMSDKKTKNNEAKQTKTETRQ